MRARFAMLFAAALALGGCSSTGGTCAPIPCPAPGFDPQTCTCRTFDGGPPHLDGGADATPDAALDATPDTATDASADAMSDAPPTASDAAAPATVDMTQTLSDPTLHGTGSCAGVTLGDVVTRARADNPALADITDFVGPYLGDRERVIFAFAIPNGFRVVFKRGSGDCPAGCISNEYWYFETDAACLPQPAGHYSAQYKSPGNCFVIDGAPVWGFPNPRAPACP